MKKKIIIAVAVIVILAAGGTFYLNHKINSAVKDGKIIKGVSCEGISIGGMTRSEAKDAIESHMKEIHQEKITLYVDDERSSAKIEDLGAFAEADKTVEEAYALGRSGSIFTKYSDVKEKKHKLPVYRKYDKAKFEKNVKKATKKIVSEPRNASVKRKAGKFVVIKEKTGYTLNMNETFANFKKAVEAGKHQFELDVVKKKAKYTSKDMAEIKDVLGTYTTEYGGSPYGRKVNVANGASKINGSIVYPGETLSVYKTVSPFTKENGYALAGSYENGQTVQTYGGGICQVSTTLYNAVIRAELKIVERFPHSMTVHYVPRSADAAIAGTHKDMKFKNTFDTPIYIEGKANGSTITFTVYGKKKDPKRGIKSTEGLFAHGVYMEVKNIESPNDRNMTISDTHNSASFRIARLGEAYLLYAEACLETGNLDEGKKYLNAIQKRAEAPETELTTQTLRDEKQYELWFETCRFHDIVRWGIAKECQDAVVDQVPQLYDDFFIQGTPYYGKEHHLRAELTHPLSVDQNLPASSYGFVKGKHEYFPFPKDVIDLNKELHQLNGWANN